ncbi:MAG: Uma2 family endonuclease, partial [bacterium]|nr:Uma2 family endonuclease [bacterium]
MSSHPDYDAPGPFLAAHVRDGDPYELSNGHPIACPPSSPLDGSSNLVGGQVLDTDPDVEWAGVEAGYSPNSGTLRAAAIALDRPPAGDVDGWMPGAPRLAVEYAAAGQDEMQLQKKIAEFFAHGSELIWVGRLLGPRRVEVYGPDGAFEVKTVGEELTAPGILRNPVPVLALFDRAAGHRAVFRNLLQREGYENLDAVRMEGWKEGQAR